MKLYVNGKWIGEELEQLDITNPANGDVVDQVPKGGEKEAALAVDAAANAFKSWSTLSTYERCEKLELWHHYIHEQTEELAKLMTLEQGKAIKELAVKLVMQIPSSSGMQKKGSEIMVRPSLHQRVINDSLRLNNQLALSQQSHRGIFQRR